MEPGDGVGGFDEIPQLPGETPPADPADSVLQGPTELPGVFYGLDMIFGFFALHLHGRRRRYYLAGEQILGYRGKEGDRLNWVDLDIGRELQLVCVGADSAFNRKRAELLPIQLSRRPGCRDVPRVQLYLIPRFELRSGAAGFVVSLRIPEIHGCHLGPYEVVDIPEVGGCLVCARLLRVLYWLIEVDVHSGVSPEGGEEGGVTPNEALPHIGRHTTA